MEYCWCVWSPQNAIYQSVRHKFLLFALCVLTEMQSLQDLPTLINKLVNDDVVSYFLHSSLHRNLPRNTKRCYRPLSKFVMYIEITTNCANS